MNSTRKWHSRLSRPAQRIGVKSVAKMSVAGIAAFAFAVAISVAAWFALGDGASAFTGAQAGAQSAARAQASGPEANLPYLFAVYIITWAAFFAYVFYVSRRQREMQTEIDALKRALESRSTDE